MFKNLTPHKITVCDTEGNVYLEIAAPEDKNSVPRVSEQYQDVEINEGVHLYTVQYGTVVNLPEQEESVYLIVSGMIRAALPNRKDLVSPGKPVRNAEGQIIGCQGFIVS